MILSLEMNEGDYVEEPPIFGNIRGNCNLVIVKESENDSGSKPNGY